MSKKSVAIIYKVLGREKIKRSTGASAKTLDHWRTTGEINSQHYFTIRNLLWEAGHECPKDAFTMKPDLDAAPSTEAGAG